ncbi:hypothetical protein AOZ07_01420 [Glutamicibacter halophytocola]|uniref:hypothetical protein n=1 Tax=Glutamicibacter halophytocola TaxID=1933880 RepID=UPI0006D49D1A|nr:hypothetical protein [Glutamicibacter halophytocola]ALG27788.1 hypothetical protein AOZ07_01420 [Glutamicibacter halophytocola]
MTSESSEYLSELHQYVQKIIKSLLAEFSASSEQRAHDVLLKLKGPNLEQFTLVLGGEIAEVNYDDRFYGYEQLSDEREELREFTREIVNDIVVVSLRGIPMVERKKFLGASKLVLPRENGVDFLLRKRHSSHF